jgi:hypothetical protein
MKLSPFVSDDRLESAKIAPGDDANGMLFGPAGAFSDEHKAGFALHKRGHTIATLSDSHHRVDLSVARPLTLLHGGRPFVHYALSGQSARGIIAAVAPAALLEGLAQLAGERAAFAQIAPEGALDRLMADLKFSVPPQAGSTIGCGRQFSRRDP